MILKIVDDYDAMSEFAAKLVADLIIFKKKAVLGFATGSTPEGMYTRLVEMYRQGKIDFKAVTAFNLDEYVSLSPDHPQSYYAYMCNNIFKHVNINPKKINIPSSNSENINERCKDYEKKITKAGGIDLQVLGIGINGHIGFNEPAQYLRSSTHLVELAEETIKANSRFFQSIDEVPRQAITMGMGSIMKANRILLLASGGKKAEAIRNSFSGFVTTESPASFLQLHKDAVIVIDRKAASLL